MTSEGILSSSANLAGHSQSAVNTGKFCYRLAKPEDNAELIEFSAKVDMPGAIRFSLDRSPDYFAALSVEGSHSDVLTCRENNTGRLVAAGLRSVKKVFVNGESVPVGYLSGLRVEPGFRSATFLSRGYAQLRTLRAQQSTPFDLTTVMEDNHSARKVLLSRRLGLPAYHDFGRFCCMALALHGSRDLYAAPKYSVRQAASADAGNVVEFLNREGCLKQFFPEYHVEDFGRTGGLLSHLEWSDIFLALRGSELVGVLAAWNQQAFRRWRVTGYATGLRLSRHFLNLAARVRRVPLLPKTSLPLNSFSLALVCIRDSDYAIFRALLNQIIRARQDHHAFFLAGLHERDPLLPELQSRPHVLLNSRLYLVDWENDSRAIENLDRQRVPYLELGSL